MEAAEFESVLTGAQAGTEWAWASLFDDLAGPVTGFLRARGAPEPEDALSEVFVQLAKNIGTFEGTYAQFRAWVFTIARSRMIDQRRYLGRRPSEPLEGHDIAGGSVEPAALDSISSAAVLKIIQELSDAQQEVLMLRIFADMTIDQIAKTLKKPQGAVKQLQRRALRSLAKNIESGHTPFASLDG